MFAGRAASAVEGLDLPTCRLLGKGGGEGDSSDSLWAELSRWAVGGGKEGVSELHGRGATELEGSAAGLRVRANVTVVLLRMRRECRPGAVSAVVGVTIPVSAAVKSSAMATGIMIRARLLTFWLLSPAELGESAGDSKELGRLSAAADATVAEVTVAAAAAGSFTPAHNISACGKLVMAAGVERRNRLLPPWLHSPAELGESAGASLVVGKLSAAGITNGFGLSRLCFAIFALGCSVLSV